MTVKKLDTHYLQLSWVEFSSVFCCAVVFTGSGYSYYRETFRTEWQ